GGTAVLVRDEDQLRTGGTHALQDGLPAQAFRNGGDGAGEAFDGGRRQSLRLQRDRVLDVDDADRVVQIATGNGETGVAGLHCEQDQLVGGVLLIQRLDGGTRRHDVVGGDVPESQGTVQDLCLGLRELAGTGGGLHDGGQLLRATCAGQLIGRFDAEAVQHKVREVVQPRDETTEELVEGPHRADRESCDLDRVGDRQVLRHQLAEDHGEGRGQDDGEGQRDRHRGGVR